MITQYNTLNTGFGVAYLQTNPSLYHPVFAVTREITNHSCYAPIAPWYEVLTPRKTWRCNRPTGQNSSIAAMSSHLVMLHDAICFGKAGQVIPTYLTFRRYTGYAEMIVGECWGHLVLNHNYQLHRRKFELVTIRHTHTSPQGVPKWGPKMLGKAKQIQKLMVEKYDIP